MYWIVTDIEEQANTLEAAVCEVLFPAYANKGKSTDRWCTPRNTLSGQWAFICPSFKHPNALAPCLNAMDDTGLVYARSKNVTFPEEVDNGQL